MNRLQSFLYLSRAFVIGWASFVVIGISTASTHVVNSLENMGFDVSFAMRMDILGQDLINMLALYGTIFGVALLLAFLSAALFIRLTRLPLPHVIYGVAGFVGILVAFLAMKAAFGITPIAISRSLSGLLIQSLGGAVAGVLFSLAHHAVRK